ncbi:unnamed protein product, partial [Vitis vinifera]
MYTLHLKMWEKFTSLQNKYIPTRLASTYLSIILTNSLDIMSLLIHILLFQTGTTMFRTSFLLLAFMAAATSIASTDKQTYVVHMDKAKITALRLALGDSKKWYEAVVDSIIELSTQDEEEETSPPQLLYTYETAMTGFAAKLSIKQLQALDKVEGFLSAVPDELLSLHTTHSPQFLGLHKGKGLWSTHNLATDVIIGIIDSGIWPEHVSFHDWGMSPVPSKWKGYEARAGRINETVDYRSARDSQGHGTHTASTAAGDMVAGASIFGMAKGSASGMMYTSRIAAYKVCYIQASFGAVQNGRTIQYSLWDINVLPSSTPFACGSGHVNPEKASDPGLIYDITTDDYLNHLCSLNYTSSQIALVSRGIILFNGNAQNNSATYKRTVTNVGQPTSTYVAQVQEPDGVSVMVEPSVLKFRKFNQRLSYKVSFVAMGAASASVPSSSFGSLVWVSKKHRVRSPIAITWQSKDKGVFY